MKRQGILALLLIMSGLSLLNAQSIRHDWRVVDRGGGVATGTGLVLRASIGQAAVQTMTQTGFVLEGGWLPGARFMSGTLLAMDVPVTEGWNMLSVPLVVPDYDKDSCYPTATSPAYTYRSGYADEDTLENGIGYWLKFGTPDTVAMSGSGRGSDSVEVRAGWNMVGTISYPMRAAEVGAISPATILSPFYAFVAGLGYRDEDTLKPGQGYWVKVDSPGVIIFASGGGSGVPGCALAGGRGKEVRTVRLKELAASGAITGFNLRDATGRERQLYFSGSPGGADLVAAELPPPPPAGIMDARFRTERLLESYDYGKGGLQTFPIVLSEAVYPVTITWNLAAGEAGYSLETIAPDGTVVEQDVGQTGTLVIERGLGRGLVLKMDAGKGKGLPRSYALEQNFPNPFNPRTEIRYAIPDEVQVTLKIYNVLGQEIQTLVNEVEKPGYKSLFWNALDVGTGTYFYELRAGSYVCIRKLMVLK